MMRARLLTRNAVLVAAIASASFAAADAPSEKGETVEQSLCRLIEASSRERKLPVSYMTRLIWQESSFRSDVTSRAGAQGVAQFMPGTARQRGLADPFDPEQAIPAAATFIAELEQRFGNLGLAAAAYNAGPARVTAWLAGRGGLPEETRSYVARITGRAVDDWAAEPRDAPKSPVSTSSPDQSCLQVTADLRRRGGIGSSVIAEGSTAAWGVQLAGGFSKALALATYDRSRARLGSVLGDIQPMILGTRLRSRGTLPFYRIRVPAQTRTEADGLCTRIRSTGGACIVLKT